MENCLLITIDSLRFDYVSPQETPTLSRLAEEGCFFDQAFATGPGTSPSFPAMLTGTLPLSYGGLGPLSKDRPRVAKSLQEAGLETGGFQCNPFLSRHFNYDAGFDTFEDYQNPLMGIATKLFPRGIELNNPKLRRVDEYIHLTDIIKDTYRIIKGKPRPYVSADVITDDATAWIRDQDGPFFCWAHYMDVHHPCHPPEEYRKRNDVSDITQSQVADWYSTLLKEPESLSKEEVDALRGLYRSAIEYTDAQVNRLVDTLASTGLLENTIAIITSDHGELFGEYGEYGKPERMYDELLRIPLIVLNPPDHIAKAGDELVSLLDIPPLIHDAFGIETPATYEGQRLAFEDPREYILAEHEAEGDVVVGARSTEWLYVADEIYDERRLYDLREGFEVVDTATETEAGADIVRDAVNRRLTELDVEPQALTETVEGDIEDRLEDLGYL